MTTKSYCKLFAARADKNTEQGDIQKDHTATSYPGYFLSRPRRNPPGYEVDHTAVQHGRFFAKIYSLLPEGGAASQYSVFIGQKMSLTGQSNGGQRA